MRIAFGFALRDCNKREKPAGSQVQRWVMMSRVQHITVTWMALLVCFLLPICIWFEFLIMDSSVFSLFFDKTGLNDASLANDTRKNHLSVHYCSFRFLSDWFLLSLLFFPFIIKLRITWLPGLFSTQQLRTDVRALFFMVLSEVRADVAVDWIGLFGKKWYRGQATYFCLQLEVLTPNWYQYDTNMNFWGGE